jgi:protein tyrosine phosphatase (PTP) superfamily phosphohydrolase (DUF442 family)
MNRSLGRLLLASWLGALAGCCHDQRRPAPPPVVPLAPRPVVVPVSPAPMAPPGTFQPAPPPYPAVPPGISPAGPPANPFPMVPPPPNPAGASLPPNESIARVENRWQPVEKDIQVEKGIQLGAPESIAGTVPKEAPRLYPPDKTAEPPLAKSATTLPVGIPQFATAMDNVATGLRPSLDDGLDWLQARGYRTVAHIRLPSENDDADRKQVEKRGMKYLSIEVSPQTLTKAAVEEFGRIVSDTSGQPVFIYDRDGALAGGLWYLYFRTTLQLSDDVARIRAGSLGLREDRDGAQRDMWLAIQKYLNEKAR